MNLAVMFLLSAAAVSFTAAAAERTNEPPIALERALEMAKQHAASTRIDLSEHYLDSIYHSTYDKHPENNRWNVIWRPKNYFTLDGEINVSVYDDGRIKDSTMRRGD